MGYRSTTSLEADCFADRDGKSDKATEGMGKNTAVKPAKKRLTAHRASYLVHSFIGLKLSLLFSVVLVTGAIAVFAEELDWLIYSEMRATAVGDKLNEGEVFDRMQAAFPGVGLTGYSTAADRKYTAAHAMMTLPEGGFKKVWADPYTGDVNGVTEFLTVGEFFSILHRNLFMPLIGRAMVNVFGVLCLIGLITGLISYRRFWRGFFTLPRWRAKPRVFLGDLHKFIGLWSLWFVLIIGVSGSWWFYQNPLVKYDLAPQFIPSKVIDPGLTRDDLARLGRGVPEPLSSQAIVDAVKAHDPEFKIHFLVPPEHNGMAYTVRGTKHDLLTPKWTSSYFVNPFTGEIIGERLAENLSALQRVDWAMVPLHYGTWGYDGIGDLLVKIVWFVFGLAMAGLSISGMIIFYQRTRNAVQKTLPDTDIKRKLKKTWFVLRPWGGPMGGFKYLNWAFLAVIAIGINIGFKIQSEGTSGSGYQYISQDIGAWTISLNATLGLLEKDLDPIQPGRATTLSAFIKSGDPEAIKFMYLNTRKPRTNRAPGSVVHGSIGFLHANLPVPKSLKQEARLWLTIEDWDGNFYRTSWPLMPDGQATLDLRKSAELTNGLASNADLSESSEKGRM
ncbi:PepSY-associated TM helix domain-containing protein [Aestuariirhabdus haliotis]|uniref:PepSY-associated TM helix domain-containing protein n=1 Tax=Aestuariirhabdus haliotis TaxID=2918751 RepID=UPI0020BEDD1F|nr:PepSY-associated TM helix domain-containing protein [Aestuariirhabdus haliotis]MCL6420592.1 PepSY domain-containing protein [Aestuariirhabdus haliotis]